MPVTVAWKSLHARAMKNNLFAAASKIRVCVYLCMLSGVAAAQGNGTIVESRGITPGQAVTRTAAPATASNDALSLLLDQIQQLQTEVQALRGMVEEQGFELRRLQQDSLSRYSNTDERLSALEAGGLSAAPTLTPPASATTPIASAPDTSQFQTPTTAASDIARTAIAGTGANSAGVTADNASTGAVSAPTTSVAATTPSRATSRGTLEPAVFSEQQLYQMAYDSVINSNFERSIAEFDQYLSIYPTGRFVTNAHYWKGQAYLYLNRFDEARESYEIILNETPPSPKLPDAMYGLALAYQGLGNIPQARRLLTDIKRRFPNTGTANLADTRLLSLQ